MTDSRDQALALVPELRAIQRELEVYETLLRQWQRSINLISGATLKEVWLRHFADSAQVQLAAPDASIWADLGSGGGFPGLVIALLLKDRPGAMVHLIESDQRKAAFLRAVSRETHAPATVHVGRIEARLAGIDGVEAVSARALAPLGALLALAEPVLQRGATGVFLKGEDWRQELTELKGVGNLTIQTFESRTDSRARIVVVKKQAERAN